MEIEDTANTSNTGDEGKATPGADDIEARIAALVDARLDKAVEARLAPLTTKYNKELAGLRKKVEARGETPDADTEAGKSQAPKPAAAGGLTWADLKSYESIARLRAKLPEEIADEVDPEGGELSVPERLRALEVATKVHARAPKTDTSTEKPGRDARTNGSQRSHPPATRTSSDYPATFEAWDALKIDQKRELRTKFPDRDPRDLPRAR